MKKLIRVLPLVICAMAISLPASAQSKSKKVSVAQVYAKCLKWLDQDTPRSADNQAQRFDRGTACLRQNGVTF